MAHHKLDRAKRVVAHQREREESWFSARPVKSMSKDGLLELPMFSSCQSEKCSVHVVQARARDPPPTGEAISIKITLKSKDFKV